MLADYAPLPSKEAHGIVQPTKQGWGHQLNFMAPYFKTLRQLFNLIGFNHSLSKDIAVGTWQLFRSFLSLAQFISAWLFNFSGYSLADGHFLCERRERISLKKFTCILILLSKREKFISLGLWSECQTERDLPLPRLGSRCKVFIQTVVISGLLSVPTAWLRPSRGRYFYRQSPYLACCLYQLHG